MVQGKCRVQVQEKDIPGLETPALLGPWCGPAYLYGTSLNYNSVYASMIFKQHQQSQIMDTVDCRTLFPVQKLISKYACWITDDVKL